MASLPSTSKALYLTGFGGYDKYMVEEEPLPQIGAEEVLVNVRATGINFAELMMRQGIYNRNPKCPAVQGFEGAGDVVKVAPEVTKFKVGDRVLCFVATGMWREHAALPVANCFKMPDCMSYEHGAAIPLNYITAYQMLFDFGNLRRGRSVLVHMVAGGVGNAAVQLCRSVENVTIFGTCSAAKHEVMRKAGVDHLIDYRTQNYADEIRKVSPKGVDIVLDPLSGSDSTNGFNLLKPLGKIVHFGAANTVAGESRSLWKLATTWWATKSHNPLFMMSDNKAICGYHVGVLIDDPENTREATETLIKMYEEGKIKPVIDSVWALEDVGKAQDRMHSRKNVGKVIMSPQAVPGSSDIRTKTG